MKQRMLMRLGLWIVAVALGFGMLRAFEHSQVFHPDKVLVASASKLGRPFEEVDFQARDGARLHGWYFPETNAPAAPVFLYCHGNAGNISHRLDTAGALLSAGASVMIFDYRGYGRSAGRPSEEGTYRDAHAAYDWLLAKGHPADRIMVFGESLGGGVASELAASATVGGLVLQSTFTRITDLGAELFPWIPVRLLGSIRYPTIERLPSIRVPVLVLHSRGDGLVRYAHAERNFAAANEPKLLVEIRGDHNEPLLDRAAFGEGIRRFLELAAAVPRR